MILTAHDYTIAHSGRDYREWPKDRAPEMDLVCGGDTWGDYIRNAANTVWLRRDAVK